MPQLHPASRLLNVIDELASSVGAEGMEGSRNVIPLTVTPPALARDMRCRARLEQAAVGLQAILLAVAGFGRRPAVFGSRSSVGMPVPACWRGWSSAADINH